MDPEPGTSKTPLDSRTDSTSDYFHVPVNTDNDMLGCCLAACCAVGAVLCVEGADGRKNRKVALTIGLIMIGFGLVLSASMVILWVYVIGPSFLKPRHHEQIEGLLSKGNWTVT